MHTDTYTRNHEVHKTEAEIEQIRDREDLIPFKFPVTFPQQRPENGVLHAVHVTSFGFSEDHARKRLLKMSMEDVVVGVAIRG